MRERPAKLTSHPTTCQSENMNHEVSGEVGGNGGIPRNVLVPGSVFAPARLYAAGRPHLGGLPNCRVIDALFRDRAPPIRMQ